MPDMSDPKGALLRLCKLVVRANELDSDLINSGKQLNGQIGPLRKEILLRMGGGEIHPWDDRLLQELLDAVVKSSSNPGELTESAGSSVEQLLKQILRRIEESDSLLALQST